MNDNVLPLVPRSPSLDPGTLAHQAATEHLDTMYELLARENDPDAPDVDWSETPAMAPFCGCTDCVVREILYAGMISLQGSGVDLREWHLD